MAGINGRASQWLTGAVPLLLTALLAGGSYWLAWLTGLQGWSDAPKGSQTTPDYFIENFTLKRVSLQDTKRSELHGKRIEHIPNLDTVTVTSPRFDNELSGGPHLQAWSDTGTYSNQTGQLLMTANVQVRREPPTGEVTVVKTQRLDMDTDNQVAWMPEGADVQRGLGTHITSQTMRVNNLEGVMQANGRVKMIIDTKANAGATP